MRQTLRRSCSACANAKSRCDLRTPHCSRCVGRKILCVYANEPLSASPGSHHHLAKSQFGSVDPFESYPPVRLRKGHVQRLIHSFLHKIAFQYYPLDLNPNTNPFLISWWPLALADPVLFHVSLQTACLDEEFFGRKGFQTSELLMADSVVLLRRKVQDLSLAMQDGTMNSIITLATIEYGKGNIETAKMHVMGAKRLVNIRGGIQAVMQTSPLTARMVSWISMLIMGVPQFETQDGQGIGHGISPIHEWQIDQTVDLAHLPLSDVYVEPAVWNVFARLYNIFQRARRIPLFPTRLHDLTCFVVHRLLPLPTSPTETCSDRIRCAIILYMLILQGPTYYTHASLLHKITARLASQLSDGAILAPLDVWLVAIGLVAAHGTPHYNLFQEKARCLSTSLGLETWETSSTHIKSILWLDAPHTESVFQSHWDIALGHPCPLVTFDAAQIAPFNSSSLG